MGRGAERLLVGAGTFAQVAVGGRVVHGLAIVAQQVALHGGALRLEDSDLGGLGVHVALPATGGPAPSGR